MTIDQALRQRATEIRRYLADPPYEVQFQRALGYSSYEALKELANQFEMLADMMTEPGEPQ